LSNAAADTLEKVSREFENEVLSDLESGRKETIAKVESARKETAEEVSKVIETGTKQAESVKRQIIGAAELDVRNAQLRALEKGVNEAFELATKEISDSETYSDAIDRLIEEGLEIIDRNAKVQCSTKDKKVVAAAIRKLGGNTKVSLDDEPIDTVGGVVLTTTDGTVRFDNTIEARLERMKPTLRKEVAAVLTG
jgi:V/A-type H+/Na+-transporting ATPase subunit E